MSSDECFVIFITKEMIASYAKSDEGNFHLSWVEALVLSISSSLGRGFFPSTLQLGDPAAIRGVTEGVIALFIEDMLIATFAKRSLDC